MKIVIETSTLVSGSIFWEYELKGKTFSLKHRFFKKCNDVFMCFKGKGMEDNVIITKTVETKRKTR